MNTIKSGSEVKVVGTPSSICESLEGVFVFEVVAAVSALAVDNMSASLLQLCLLACIPQVFSDGKGRSTVF